MDNQSLNNILISFIHGIYVVYIILLELKPAPNHSSKLLQRLKQERFKYMTCASHVLDNLWYLVIAISNKFNLLKPTLSYT